MTTIDARGLSCPEPVIMTRKALKGGQNRYTVLVDNVASRENVTRFAESQGFRVKLTEESGQYRLELSR